MSSESDTSHSDDTEMNTGVSDTDAPSPQQAGGAYLRNEGTAPPETLPDEAADLDTEMNTGVSDADAPSPDQAGGAYLRDETTARRATD